MKTKIIVLLTTLALSAALFAVASAATGAYFSDSKAGAVTGNAAAVTVAAGANADLGGGLNFNWPSMVPGQVYTARAYYTNTGDVPQNISIVFPNKTALSALNSLGAYGAVQIVDSSSGQVFYSNNLIDHPHDVQGAAGLDGRGTLRMLPQTVAVRNDLPVGATGYVDFKFQYATKLGDAGPIGADGKPKWAASTGGNFKFNTYPAPYTGGSKQDLALMADGVTSSDQVTIIASDGTGSGLPFQIVATQSGKTPTDVGGWAGF